MVEVRLRTDCLPPGGPEFPSICVVCGKPCDTLAGVPVGSSVVAGIQALIPQFGPQQRVPMHHQEGCLRRLRREHFRVEAMPLLIFLAFLGLTVMAGVLAAKKLVIATMIVTGLSLFVIPWVYRHQQVAFSMAIGVGEGFRGVLVIQFNDPELAAEFSRLNERALAAN